MLRHMPFYPNKDDFHCINAAMRCVLRHYQRKEYSETYLDSLLRSRPKTWPWMPECALVLHELGLKVKYFAKINMMDYLKGEAFIRTIIREHSNSYIKRTDFERLRKAVYRLETLELFDQRDLSLDEVSTFIKKGYAPIFVINNIFVKPRPKLGKYVVVTRIDNSHVYYHETGPSFKYPNFRVKKEDFEKAWFDTKEMMLVMGNQKVLEWK